MGKKGKPPLPNSLREKREFIRDLKRKAFGDPKTSKLKIKSAPLSISGKRKRKLFNRMWKDHKEALVKGLETMDDMEMVPVNDEGTSKEAKKNATKFCIKKNVKVKLNKKRVKGKVLMEDSEPTVDAMEE